MLGVPGRDALGQTYAWPATDDPHVRACFVVSLDGRVTGGDGRSGSLGNAADAAAHHHLRSTCDVVLVGAGTARAEGYAPIEPSELDQQARADAHRTGVPALAVVSHSGEIPARLRTPGAAPTHLVTHEGAGAAGGGVMVAGRDAVDLGAMVSMLHRLGYRRILLEGGPTLLSSMLAAGCVDDLCLTHRTCLVGQGPLLVPELTVGGELVQRDHLVTEGAILARYARVVV